MCSVRGACITRPSPRGRAAARRWTLLGLAAAPLALLAPPALAQRVNENVTVSADDAFGAAIGNERVGLYSGSDVRGFSPISAGNIRLEGLYIDRVAEFSERLVGGDTVRVGITAQNYPFTAPTGVDDFSLRPANAKAVLSATALASDNGAYRFELDGQAPLAGERLTLSAGAGLYHRVFTSGATGEFASYAVRLRWRPTASLEVSPFWGRLDTYDKEAFPTFVTASAFIPEGLMRGTYVGPDWAGIRTIATNYGVIAKSDTQRWRLQLGLFRSVNDTPENYTLLLRNLTRDGLADRLLIADPALATASSSGELRVDRRFEEGDRRHTVSLSLRGRRRTADYGGSVTVDYGRSDVNSITVAAKPAFAFGAPVHETVEQITPGLGYELRWRGVGSLNLGLQRTAYRKSVLRPGAAESKGRDDRWLYNASAAINLSERLAVYASASSGLEESGVAPESAENRRQILPTIHTTQTDAGVRILLPRNVRLVAGVFDIRKPYFASDRDNFYVEAGDIRHRGVEFSVTASPAQGLTLVGGAVFMQPRVSGLSVERGLISKHPVAAVTRVVAVSASYTPPGAPRLTVGANLYHHGPRTASSSNLSQTPAATFLDLTARYRLTIKDRPAVVKLQASNVTDELDFTVYSSNSFGFNNRRIISLSLTVDI